MHASLRMTLWHTHICSWPTTCICSYIGMCNFESKTQDTAHLRRYCSRANHVEFICDIWCLPLEKHVENTPSLACAIPHSIKDRSHAVKISVVGPKALSKPTWEVQLLDKGHERDQHVSNWSLSAHMWLPALDQLLECWPDSLFHHSPLDLEVHLNLPNDTMTTQNH